MSSSSLFFNVQRTSPEMIAPSEPTPRGLKHLSDIDDQPGLRLHSFGIEFYKRNEGMEGKDPVKVIRNALAKTLVSYYPFAGRLREGTDGKLAVDCTGEGVLFIEADADVSLDMFGELVHPPFPGYEELLYDVPGSSDLLNTPMMLVQVTRLTCGGFIFAIRYLHTICDGAGSVLFMNALCETARGATVPSLKPVWKRELLSAQEAPQQVSCIHHEYASELPVANSTTPMTKMVERAFFFGAQEASALRNQLPPHIKNSTFFEILTACLWRCRTTALNIEPDKEVRLLVSIDARSKFNPPLPAGYYGNAVAFPAAVTTAGELCDSPLEYAVHLVKKTKTQVTEEYMRSIANLMVLKGRPHIAIEGAFLVSDLSRSGFQGFDFGWGNAVYAGPGKGGVDSIPGVLSFYLPTRSKNGEHGLVVPISLPVSAMERFAVELEKAIGTSLGSRTSRFIVSRL